MLCVGVSIVRGPGTRSRVLVMTSCQVMCHSKNIEAHGLYLNILKTYLAQLKRIDKQREGVAVL